MRFHGAWSQCGFNFLEEARGILPGCKDANFVNNYGLFAPTRQKVVGISWSHIL